MITSAISLADYHASEAISKSKLSRFAEARSPLDYVNDKQGLPKSEAFAIGQLVEDLLQLGEGAYNSSLAVQTWGLKKSDAIERHRVDNDTLIRAMVSAVRAHPLAGQILAGQTQVTGRVSIGCAQLQCRPDWWYPQGLDGMSDPLVIDLKTCESLADFDADFIKFKYHWQAAIYRSVLGAALRQEHGLDYNPTIGVRFLAVDKAERPAVTLFTPCDEHYRLANDELTGANGALTRMLECIRTGVWPDVPTERNLTVPAWLERRYA